MCKRANIVAMRQRSQINNVLVFTATATERGILGQMLWPLTNYLFGQACCYGS